MRRGIYFCSGWLLLAAATALVAKPLSSPLATPPDAIGRELQGAFISAPVAVATQTNASFIAYRKSFYLDAVPKSAQLHLFADARYLLWVNGQPTHRGPNRFDIHGPQYDTVEIGSALRAGSNTFAIVVMGHARPRAEGTNVARTINNARMMHHDPGLTARLDMDGNPRFKTDATWKWSDKTRYRPAKIGWADIIDRIDARVEDGDWTLPEYNDQSWPAAVAVDGNAWGALVARRIPLLRDTPVGIKFASDVTFPVTLTAGQQLKFSLGKLYQAYTVLDLDADEGTEITLNYAGVDYIARAGRQSYISSDSRALDGGVITVKSGRATILNLKLVERLYPFDRIGSFTSSDPFLNQLWNICARSLEILSEDAYVDCADRERAEWMDDDPPAFDITRTAFAAAGPDGKPIFADARLLGEMLRRTALSQQPEGWVKAHTCSDRFDIHAHMEDRSCDWVQGARRYHESTGDKSLIRKIWPAVVRQLDFFLNRRTERGLVRSREWVVWGNPVGYVTCEGTGLNAFVYKALADAAFLGRVIGESKDADRFSNEAAALAKAINTVLWNEAAGTYYSGYITPADLESSKGDKRAAKMPLAVENNLIASSPYAALWALDQEIVTADRRARVTSYLLSRREELQRDHVMPYYYLFKQLYAVDMEAFDREILQTLRTQWKPMAESGWQTSWEAISMSPQFRGSRAHTYGMFPGYFLSAYVLGVRPEAPASAKRLLIEPRLGDLTSAQGTVVTEAGPVSVMWQIENDALNFRVEVPKGVSATLRVPSRGKGSILKIGGKTTTALEKGRYLETLLPGGTHEGSVTAAP